MFGGRGTAVAVASLLLMATSWGWAPAGLAAGGGGGGGGTGGVLCTGHSISTYDPPLTLQPQETRVHTEAQYRCTVAPGRVVRATGTLDGVSPDASCLSVSNPGLTETVRYADGARSVIVYSGGTSVHAGGALLVRLTGRVSQGRGAGQSAQRTVLAQADQLVTECLASGFRGKSGEAQLEIQP
ncbi:hypothetical protein [Streptomyces sp. I05A-00742]|uniref:hypothetical protein n=1 Tax=Streptomyces sp. I05A-00742 TaxID=2732853 RepID=UPI001489F57C|nr:hypothetical protein [Streptomyces sp. I05A-00742]